MLAGSHGAYGYSLRCPACKAGVYHRQGANRRPHFAHYSGNSNRACELYHPGSGCLGSTTAWPKPEVMAPRTGRPALIWRDGFPFSTSLYLRLPKFTQGYASTLTVVSSGRRLFTGAELSRLTFERLPLRHPLATIETSPRDLPIEIQLEALLQEFTPSGSYFRASTSEGILEDRLSPLELGEEYFLITQRRFEKPFPASLSLLQERKELSWTAYRFHLRDEPNTRDEDISQLECFLERRVIAGKSKIDIIWPPPRRYYPDGVPAYSNQTSQFVARSNSGIPNCVTLETSDAQITPLCDGYFQVDFERPAGEAILWTEAGARYYFRFDDLRSDNPTGVQLRTPERTADLTSIEAATLVGYHGAIEVKVPTEQLWRNVLVNGVQIRPLPNGKVHSFDGPIQTIDAGAFGAASSLAVDFVVEANDASWCSRFERVVSTIAGPTAFEKLHSARTKHQVLRWATDHNAISLLPLMLSAFSAEVDRGIS